MAGVWDYGNEDDIEPLQDSSDEEESKAGSYDNIALLPASKRRKLQQQCRAQKDVELIDLDNEDRDGEKTGSRDIYTCNKLTGRGVESDSDLDFDYRPPVKSASDLEVQLSRRGRQAHASCLWQSGPGSMPLDPIILQNQALLRSFKEAAQEAILEEILPEPALLFPSRRTTAKPQLTNEEDDGSAGAASQEEAASPLNVEDDGKVVLLLQSKEGKISLRISKQAPLSKLFEPYKQQAIQKGWLPSAKAAFVKFDFDGDRLSGTETAEGLDCEDNNIIEVKW